MDGAVAHIKQVRRDAAMAFLRAFSEGRPLRELETDLPCELEASGQEEAAFIVRSFFHVPGVESGGGSDWQVLRGRAPGRRTAETSPDRRA
jgi:hypothetical protein